MSLFKKYAKATGAVVAGLMLMLQVAMPATASATYGHNDVTFCLADGNGTYTKETMTDEDIVNTQLTGDNIVPEFIFGGQQYSHNWDTKGQTIWHNNCEAVAEKATLTIVKDALPDNKQNFKFLSDELGTFKLDDDNTPYLDNTKVFTDLTAGEYGVREEQLWGWSLNNLVCEGTQNYQVYWDEARVQVTLQAGDNVVCTFVNEQLNALGGFKFEDLNLNGKWDHNEPTLEGWTITLTDQNGDTKSIKTNSDGFYTFTGLASGTYTVCEEQQAGWMQTFPGTWNGCHEVTLTGPGHFTSCIHFGNVREEGEGGGGEELSEINGSKFNDVNGDTAWNADEPTLSGWTITLKDMNDNVLATQQTDQQGFYRFADLQPGTYKVCETQQAGWSRTYPADNDCHVIQIGAGDVVTADFGNKPLPQVQAKGAEAPASTTATLVNTGVSITTQLLAGLVILSALAGIHFATIRSKEYAK
jgi:hypothetical protein